MGRGIESFEAAIATPHLLKGQDLEGVARASTWRWCTSPWASSRAITPFNFPVMLPLWFIPFALAAATPSS